MPSTTTRGGPGRRRCGMPGGRTRARVRPARQGPASLSSLAGRGNGLAESLPIQFTCSVGFLSGSLSPGPRKNQSSPWFPCSVSTSPSSNTVVESSFGKPPVPFAELIAGPPGVAAGTTSDVGGMKQVAWPHTVSGPHCTSGWLVASLSKCSPRRIVAHRGDPRLPEALGSIQRAARQGLASFLRGRPMPRHRCWPPVRPQRGPPGGTLGCRGNLHAQKRRSRPAQEGRLAGRGIVEGLCRMAPTIHALVDLLLDRLQEALAVLVLIVLRRHAVAESS
jgi:hypothetical protein